jgi:predicted acyl esterase
MVAVRLSDVAPDGRATRISYGLLNLTHRAGHDRPEALAPGQRYQVSVTLNAMAQAIPPGHRLRLALSTSYWPLAWPPPQPVRLTVYPAASTLVLPLRPDPGVDELPMSPLGEPEWARPREPPSSSRPGNAGP